MTPAVVGLLGCGEMGAGVGAALVRAGHEVLTDLLGRSEETVTRAAEAGILDTELCQVGQRSEIVLSILPPADAEPAAKTFGTEAPPDLAFVYVDANAVSPEQARRSATYFGPAVTFVDGGIVGLPPTLETRPRLYTSGPMSNRLAEVLGAAFDHVHLGPEIGAASAMKMAYASVTKGTNALLTAAFVLAERHGLGDAFAAELGATQPALYKRADAAISGLPADAGRWVREMEEIRDTYEAAGLPGGFHQAAADVMRLLDASPYGRETRRTRDRTRTMRETVAVLAAQKPAG